MWHDKDQYKELQVGENGFTYKGKDYQFEDIKHIYFKWTKTTQKMNFMKVGDYDEIDLCLILPDDSKIVITFDEVGFFYGFNKDKREDINNVIDLYHFISKKTFNMRISPYVDEVNKKGYFQINECKFYPRDKIVWRDKIFPLDSIRLIKQSRVIVIKHNNTTVFDKIKNRMKEETPFISIPCFSYELDSDVIFALISVISFSTNPKES